MICYILCVKQLVKLDTWNNLAPPLTIRINNINAVAKKEYILVTGIYQRDDYLQLWQLYFQ